MHGLLPTASTLGESDATACTSTAAAAEYTADPNDPFTELISTQSNTLQFLPELGLEVAQPWFSTLNGTTSSNSSSIGRDTSIEEADTSYTAASICSICLGMGVVRDDLEYDIDGAVI
jgi:hypothetical protein